jgi:hypothetical protein
MSIIAKVRYIRVSVKLLFNITFKFIPRKLRLFSILLRMDMNSYILHTQKHITTFVNPWCNRWKHHTPRCLNAPLLYMPTVLCNILNIFTPPPTPSQMVQQPLMGQGPLITMASRSHSDTPHSCRTTLDEWSARRKDPYVTTCRTHKRQTSMPQVGFKLTIPASERWQIHALHRVATGISQNV